MSDLIYFVVIYLHLGPETLSDPEYKRFLENYSCDEEKSMANPETLLGEIEAKTRELIGTESYAQMIIVLWHNFILQFSLHFFGFSQADNASARVHQE